MTAHGRWRGAWDRFWFSDESATNLAAFRVFVGLHSLWVLSSRDFAALAGLPSAMLGSVPDTTRWRYLLFSGQASLDEVIQLAAVAALVGVVLGVSPRFCALVAGLALYHLAPLETLIWGAVPKARGLTFAAVALPLLASSRCGDALSPHAQGTGQRRSWEYRWPLRLMAVLVVQLYLFSAIGKLGQAGLDWGSAENMRAWFLWFNTTTESSVFRWPGLFLADRWPPLLALIGYGTVFLEWTIALVLFFPRLTIFYVGAAALFHIASAFTLNIYVGEAWYLLVFVDWTALRFGRGLVQPAPA